VTEPVRKQWSEEELRVAAMEFMRTVYPPIPGDKKSELRYLERLGLIVTFTVWAWDTYNPSGGSEHG